MPMMTAAERNEIFMDERHSMAILVVCSETQTLPTILTTK